MSLYNTIKSFKGISFIQFLKYTIIINTLLIFYIKFIVKNFIKDQEKTLSTYDVIKLYVNRFIHHLLTLITNVYPFIVKNTISMDIIYILYESSVIILWHLNGECVLSADEKKILDPSYVKGDIPLYQPYSEVMIPMSREPLFVDLDALNLTYIILFYVIARTIYNILHKK